MPLPPQNTIQPFVEVELIADVVAQDSEGFSFMLRAGDEGTCVAAHPDGLVDVEFLDGAGDFLCVKTLPASKLRLREEQAG